MPPPGLNALQSQPTIQQLAAALAPIVADQQRARAYVGLYSDALPADVRGAPLDAFFFNVDFLSIAAAGGTDTQTFVVPQNSDYLIVGATATVSDPAAEETTRPTSSLTIAMTDSGSGRELQNRPAGFGNLVGTGQRPAVWPHPKYLDRSSEFSTVIVNNDTVNAIRVRLSYIGFKAFSYTG